MAAGIDHPAANITFGAPRGEEDRVASLRAFATINRDQTLITSITTLWTFTDAEINEIVRTRQVMLNVLGGGLPAHFIAPESVMREFVTAYGKTWA